MLRWVTCAAQVANLTTNSTATWAVVFSLTIVSVGALVWLVSLVFRISIIPKPKCVSGHEKAQNLA